MVYIYTYIVHTLYSHKNREERREEEEEEDFLSSLCHKIETTSNNVEL